MAQHLGDLIVTSSREVNGQVTGTTYVQRGGILTCYGQLSGGLVIDEGGVAIIYGQVSRNVINNGRLRLLGQISGRLIGEQPENQVEPKQIVGTDLEVPFRGTTKSWTERF
ncbi:hypothetical protein [Bosea sp. CS1GBMeth4]|uniref:hypothetical protein n=1 Tax=Bosea sp. CS1GBMeth4 TaxID=1892849 RepID=UPI001645B0C3|nr:hypothetical protein [Bosea sp. CS1GBMeth4]